MSKKIEAAVWEVVCPIIENMGFELVDVEFFKKKNAQDELYIYIDSEEGVTLDDTEKVSRAIDEPMDVADPIPDSYIMCVSSPGLDRPLKRERDFEKARGKGVDVKLYTKLDGKKEFSGILEDWNEEAVFISNEGEKKEFKRDNIAIVRLSIDF